MPQLTEQQLALEAVQVQGACNCGAVCRTFARRVLENQDILNSPDHAIIIIWLDKIASMVPGLQSSLVIAKTETPVAMVSFVSLATKLNERLQHLKYDQVAIDAQLIAIIVEMIGLSGGNDFLWVSKAHSKCTTLSKESGE